MKNSIGGIKRMIQNVEERIEKAVLERDWTTAGTQRAFKNGLTRALFFADDENVETAARMVVILESMVNAQEDYLAQAERDKNWFMAAEAESTANGYRQALAIFELERDIE